MPAKDLFLERANRTRRIVGGTTKASNSYRHIERLKGKRTSAKGKEADPELEKRILAEQERIAKEMESCQHRDSLGRPQ